ncbi:hypothetical protein FKM82_027121 [Ascaphus truei]
MEYPCDKSHTVFVPVLHLIHNSSVTCASEAPLPVRQRLRYLCVRGSATCASEALLPVHQRLCVISFSQYYSVFDTSSVWGASLYLQFGPKLLGGLFIKLQKCRSFEFSPSSQWELLRSSALMGTIAV